MVNFLYEYNLVKEAVVLLAICLLIAFLGLLLGKKYKNSKIAKKVRLSLNIFLVVVLLAVFLVLPNIFRITEFYYSRYTEPIPAAKAFYNYLKNKNYVKAYSLHVKYLSKEDMYLGFNYLESKDNRISYNQFKREITKQGFDDKLIDPIESVHMSDYRSKKSKKYRFVTFKYRNRRNFFNVELRKTNNKWLIIGYGMGFAD